MPSLRRTDEPQAIALCRVRITLDGDALRAAARQGRRRNAEALARLFRYREKPLILTVRPSFIWATS
jgi:hypothetical protein